MRNTYNTFLRESEGKRLLDTPRCRRKDNIKVDLKEI
jgi:hypothetical protein